MNKIKVVKKKGLSQLVIKSLKGQQLNVHEVCSINNNDVPGLLHLDAVQKGPSFTLIYNITGFVSFKDYLTIPLSKETFAQALHNILQNIKAMKKREYCHLENLLLDFSYVMVNPSTQNIHFIYVPIQGFMTGYSLKEFLTNIIQYSSFIQGEDNSYVRDYIRILNNGINFSEFELEEYVNTLLGKKPQAKAEIECPRCHAMVSKGTNYCAQCGARVTGNTGNPSGEFIYDPLGGEHPKVIDNGRDENNTQEFSDTTTVLNTTPGGTTVFGLGAAAQTKYPFLIRVSNEEKITVDKSSFVIGRVKGMNDYAIPEIGVISGKHAVILDRDAHYYIKDLKSTNMTYVDDNLIPAEQEVEIHNETRIRLANEEFVFYIEE